MFSFILYFLLYSFSFPVTTLLLRFFIILLVNSSDDIAFLYSFSYTFRCLLIPIILLLRLSLFFIRLLFLPHYLFCTLNIDSWIFTFLTFVSFLHLLILVFPYNHPSTSSLILFDQLTVLTTLSALQLRVSILGSSPFSSLFRSILFYVF